MAEIWGVFGHVHRIVALGAGYVGAVERMARHMWAASPVSVGLLAAGVLLALVLAIIVIRVITRLIRSILRALRHRQQRRRIRRQLRRVPEAAVAEYAVVASQGNAPSASWLARHAPRGTLFDDHLRAVSALLILQRALPERSCLTGEAVILGQLYSHLPVLAEYLVSQMESLAIIQRAANGHSLNYEKMRYPVLIDEARNVERQLEEITRMMPVLIDQAIVNPQLASMSRVTLDLAGLRDTIRQLISIGPHS